MIDIIALTIAEQLGITVTEMRSDSRLRKFVIGRQALSYFLFKNKAVYDNITLEQIGKFLNRHHSSIVVNVQKFGNALDIGYEKEVNLHNHLKESFPTLETAKQYAISKTYSMSKL